MAGRLSPDPGSTPGRSTLLGEREEVRGVKEAHMLLTLNHLSFFHYLKNLSVVKGGNKVQ